MKIVGRNRSLSIGRLVHAKFKPRSSRNQYFCAIQFRKISQLDSSHFHHSGEFYILMFISCDSYVNLKFFQGCVMIIFGFIGCCGAIRESQPLLGSVSLKLNK